MNNREIKFRIWSKRHNKWINNYAVIDCDGNVNSHFLEICDDGQKIEHIVGLPKEENIIQQFIGISDKNGKEIYEEDIVELSYWKGDYFDNNKELNNYGVIKYVSEYATYYAVGKTKDGQSTVHCQLYSKPAIGNSFKQRIEIIGNIFETPELLK